MNESNSVCGIPEHAITLQFVRASGPGGQNVNKVSTAVQLRLDLARSGLPLAVRERLRQLVPGQVTRQDELLISAQRFRTQQRNREDALARLEALVARARRVPKKRVPTKPSAAAKRRRQEDKKVRGVRKKLRAPPASDA